MERKRNFVIQKNPFICGKNIVFGANRMKNNIIIAGVPRAGKSTISRQLANRYGYQHISMDSIIAGFEKCFPETGVNTYAG